MHQRWIAFLELTPVYLADSNSIMGEDGKGQAKVLANNLDPLSRLGGGEYLLTGDIVDIKRLA